MVTYRTVMVTVELNEYAYQSIIDSGNTPADSVYNICRLAVDRWRLQVQENDVDRTRRLDNGPLPLFGVRVAKSEEVIEGPKQLWTMFQELTHEQEKEFRAKARQVYHAGDMVSPVWHPVYRDECDKINREAGLQ